MGFLRKTKSRARLAYRLRRGVQSQIGTITRHKSSDTTKGATMIVDDNFVGIIMFLIIGALYSAYKVGEYAGETKQQQQKREQ